MASDITSIPEGKLLGTAPLHRLKLSAATRAAREAHVAAHAKAIPSGRTYGLAVLRQNKVKVIERLNALTTLFEAGKLTADGLREQATGVMRDAWDNVFTAGLRYSTVPVGGLTEDDRAWLKTAVAHEMRFFNRFMDAVAAGDYAMPLPRRIRMYAESLDSFFDSARVLGLPSNVLIHWTGPDDTSTCEGCRYLFDHSPYTKHLLPTAPKAGACSCLTACRDNLLIRPATPSETQAVTEASAFTRQQHIYNLRKLMQTGTL